MTKENIEKDSKGDEGEGGKASVLEGRKEGRSVRGRKERAV